MSVLQEIYEGWKNYLFENPKVEAEAKKRIAICVQNDCKQFRENQTCGICGCFMPAKTRSPKSECPDKRWGKMEF